MSHINTLVRFKAIHIDYSDIDINSPVVNVDKCRKDIENLTTEISQLRITESPRTFFKIPGELRNMIYKELVLMEACDDSSFKVIYSGFYLDRMSRFKEHQHPLLLINRQIKDEYLRIEHKHAVHSSHIDALHLAQRDIWPLTPSMMQTIQRCEFQIDLSPAMATILFVNFSAVA